nr:DNA mismatch repair protein [Moesziomyces parantarcticus]
MSSAPLSDVVNATTPSANARAATHDEEDRSSTALRDLPLSAVAIHVQRGHLGCAVFVEEEQQLLLCEDLPCDFFFHQQDLAIPLQRGDDQPDLGGDNDAAKTTATMHGPTASVLESLLSQFRPDVILASSTCPAPLLAVLQTFSEQRRASLDVRPARDFQLALGLAGIAEVTAGTDALTIDGDGFLPSAVRTDARVSTSKAAISISSVGPLLSALRNRLDVGRSLLLSFLSLNDYLFVDENTLRSLSICSNDPHAFVHAKAGREGFTVLASIPLLQRWIMLPLADRAEILRRHDAVELLVRQEAYSEIIEIRARLPELGRIPQICHQLNMGLDSASLWDKLRKTCHAVLRIRTELNSLNLSASQLLREIKDHLRPETLMRLGDAIEQMIDFEESKIEGKITLKAGVDGHLDELRERSANLPAFLEQIAAELKGEPAFRSVTRQIGYLIVVSQGDTVGTEYDTTLEHQFASEEAVYLKNSRMTAMDQHVGDVSSFIVDREIELLDGLHAVLDDSIADLLAAHTSLCQLDCLMAFARAAALYDLRRPCLVEEQVIKLKGSRHALKALSDESFVPNDLELRGGRGVSGGFNEIVPRPRDPRDGSRQDNDSSAGFEVTSVAPSQASLSADGKFSVMVLTGANSSGKSCLLQQAALAVFLCQCGCFVPAAHAELGVFDKILTRMRQDESVASEGSSFTRELGRLHRAMSMSTEKSLVILDEVGRECRSDDGAGLFIATIYDFLQRGSKCPIVISATHHLRAIERHFPPDLPIERAQMQTILLPTLAKTFDSLTYLYRLRPGFAGASHACHCARLCGVPESVVELAEHICRVGLRTWHDSEADRDEAIVRRLLELDLTNDGDDPQQRELDDDEARRLLELMLQPEECAGSTQG